MSETRLIATTKAQRRAADPAHSAFVSANAGAGKTKILTERVARLLLEGADPSTILCITFTKAAAAEMADRLFALLGGWSLAADPSLQEALARLDGDDRVRSAEELARARRLFARALETPGRLKIQTIHAFCESVLKRFPLEAGLAPGFTVIEEGETARLIEACAARLAAEADGEAADAFATLLSRMTAQQLRELLVDCLKNRRKFARAVDVGWAGLTAEVARALDIHPSASSRAIASLLFEEWRPEDLERAYAGLEASGGNPKKHCAAPLRAFLDAADSEARLAALGRLFCNTSGEPRGSFGTQATSQIDPWVEPFLKAAQARFLAAIEQSRAASALESTRALHVLLERAFALFGAMKAARAALDFDDLIASAKRLLVSRGGVQWVLYKLDAGLSHILLDEAQDTGPDAWDVIESPLKEFFAAEAPRTFFAVGDQKQSIYSFQGADAALFSKKQHDLGKTLAAGRFENVPVKASFRSTAPILAFVDRLYSRDEVIDNVSDERPLEHFCTREGAAGLVELWPLAERIEPEKPDPWDAPLDATPPESPSKRLASEVARTIAGWLADQEMLESEGRPIEPGDILILVQTRSPMKKDALFVEMIKALGRAGAPVAGADKIRLMDDQAVLDIVSYARWALCDGDDLSLAETLKSPFFGVSEESLYDLAAGRAERRLWNTLRLRKDERDEWRRAHDELAAARQVALGEGAVAFLTHILETGAPSGWKRFFGRLGAPCREPIEELLRQAHDFESARPRSLRLFLDALFSSGAEAAREGSEKGEQVRVMTVHKAKGLEANIVFVLDAHRQPPTGKLGDLIEIEKSDRGSLYALALGDARKAERLDAACDRAKRLMREEYRRLLYVAATRARDRLYICGHQQGNEPDPGKKAAAEKSWHALATDAFNELGAEIVDVGEKWGGRVRRLSCPQTAPVKEAGGRGPPSDHPLPDYLARSARNEARLRLSPSELAAASGDAAFSPARASRFYARGRVLHRLLELLPDVEPAARRAAADRLLSRQAEAFSAEDRAAMREEAMKVLEDPVFHEVFAPGSIAEAAIGGRLQESNITLSGRIDRLAILENRILVVDYKTNRPPPARLADVPGAYLAQMAAYRGLLQEIYPGRAIEAALLWTYDARLMILPSEALDRARSLTLA